MKIFWLNLEYRLFIWSCDYNKETERYILLLYFLLVFIILAYFDYYPIYITHYNFLFTKNFIELFSHYKHYTNIFIIVFLLCDHFLSPWWSDCTTVWTRVRTSLSINFVTARCRYKYNLLCQKEAINNYLKYHSAWLKKTNYR